MSRCGRKSLKASLVANIACCAEWLHVSGDILACLHSFSLRHTEVAVCKSVYGKSFSLLLSPTSQEDKNKVRQKKYRRVALSCSGLLVQQNKPFIRRSPREDWRRAVGAAESRSLSGSDLKPQIEAQSGEKGENGESNQIVSVLFILVIFSVHLTKINAHIMTTRTGEGAAHGQMSLTAPGLVLRYEEPHPTGVHHVSVLFPVTADMDHFQKCTHSALLNDTFVPRSKANIHSCDRISTKNQYFVEVFPVGGDN